MILAGEKGSRGEREKKDFFPPASPAPLPPCLFFTVNILEHLFNHIIRPRSLYFGFKTEQ